MIKSILKLTHENIYYLLPLIYTCEYVYIYPLVSGIHSGFGYPFGFWVSAGLVLVVDFHPNRFSVRVRVSISGFGFGCTETPPDPKPTCYHPYTLQCAVRPTAELGP
jgi:hypothetical protein